MVKTDTVLKRVIICPFESINSDEENWPERIEAGSSFYTRTQFPQQNRIPLPLKHWADIPYVLSPQRIFVEPSVLNTQGRSCMDWMQFEFSDGAILSWGVLLHSKYRDLVPIDLWPLTSKLQAMSKLAGKSADRHLAERILAEGSFELIIAAIQTCQSIGLNEQVFFADSSDPSKSRRSFFVKKIFYENAANSELIVQTQGGWVDGECKSKSAVYLKNSWGEETIHYWSVFALAPGLNQIIVSDLFFKLSNSDEFVRFNPLDGPKISKKNLVDPIKVLNSPEELNEYLNRWSALGTRIQFNPQQSSRESSDLKIDFFVDETQKIQTILSFAKDNLFVLIDWRQFRKLFNCLSSGLSALSVESIDLGSNRRKTTRLNDQKFFKSQGIAAYVIFEISNFLTQGRLSDGKVISDQKKLIESLFENCIEILDSAKGKGTSEFEAFHVSPKAISAFKDVVDEIFIYFEKKFFIFTPEQTLYVSYKDFLPSFFKNFLGFLSANTSKTLFLKIRDNAYSDFLDNNFSGNVLGARIFNKPPAEYPSEYFRNRGFYSPSQDKLLDFVLELSQNIGSVYFNGQRIDQIKSEDLSVEFQVRENKKIDWFELHPVVFFEGHEIHHKDIQWNLNSGILHFQGKLFLIPKNKIPSLKRLEKFWDRLRGSVDPAGHAPSDSYYPLPKSETLEMLALRASGFPVKGSKKWDEVCAFFDNLGNPKEQNLENKIIPELKLPLKPYQAIGVSWLNDLYKLRLGGILADEMGLGKTSQMIGFFESLRLRGELKTCMVVVPASLTYNWLSEANKFAPKLKLRAFDKSFKEEFPQGLAADTNSIVVTTYGLLVEHEEYISLTQWNIVAFDEAQQLKNLGAQRTTIARKLQAQFKVCITGTPMENHLGEFFSLVDLVVPGSLGTREEFRAIYQNKEVPPSSDALSYLRLKVKPLLLRRVKSEIQADLPEKTETVICLDFDAQQKKIYRDIASACNESVRTAIEEKGAAQSQLEMLTALMRLRQVCSDPLGIATVKYDGVPPKISQLLDSVESIIESGDSVLIFTQFLKTLERIENLLKERNINVFTLHGSIQRKDREKYLKGFSESEKPGVMLMTLKTGGVGLNLTKASYVFHLEPWWNPAVEDQATDRAHRIGQDKKVNVYRYIMRDSLEEKIEVLKERKMKLFKDLLNNESSSETFSAVPKETGNILSAQDFAYLLS
jgi:SNF2 family DNA or RNA helicase